MQQYRQMNKRKMDLSPTVRKHRQSSSDKIYPYENIDIEQQDLPFMTRVSSCQYINDNQTIRLFKNASSNDLKQETLNPKYSNRLTNRNHTSSKKDSEQPPPIDQLDQNYSFNDNPDLLKKQIVALKNKFAIKKHQYRREIQELKKQIILWERVTEENEDKFSEYKDQVEKQLFLIKSQLAKYRKMDNEQRTAVAKQSQSQARNHYSSVGSKISNSQLQSQQQMQKMITFIKTSNEQLLFQVDTLQNQKQIYLREKDQIMKSHQNKVQNLSFNLENLKQKISVLQNFQVPASKISFLERQLEQLSSKNSKLQAEIKSLKDINNQIQADLLKAMEETSQQDKQFQKEKEKEDDSFYRLSNSVSMLERLQAEQPECKQCEMHRLQVAQMKMFVQKLSSESCQRANEFQVGRSFLQNKIKQLENFIELSENEVQTSRFQLSEKIKQLQPLKLRQKNLSKANGQLKQRIQSLERDLQYYKLQNIQISSRQKEISQIPQHECQQLSLKQQLDVKTKQLLIIKNQAINCTDLYISKCRQLQEKNRIYQKAISQYHYKIQQLTITIQGLNSQIKTQSQTSEEMIIFLKEQVQRIEQSQRKQCPTEFNEILKMQIDQINSLQQAIKIKNQDILKLKEVKSQIQVTLMNLKGELQMQKLKKITDIKNVQINLSISAQNIKNQLNISKKSQQSLVNKLKYLTEQCKSKDQFIQKYIKNKNIEGSGDSMLNDYKTLTNMKQFRDNLHHELVLIDKLENQKMLLMQSIKKLQDINKMNQNEIEDVQ